MATGLVGNGFYSPLHCMLDVPDYLFDYVLVIACALQVVLLVNHNG